MTAAAPWTAPEVQPAAPESVAGERAALEAALDHQRRVLLAKCGGLTGEQLVLRSAGRSTLSLLGLVRHLADCERWWFRRWFGGETELPHRFFTEDRLEDDFDAAEAAHAPEDFAAYEEEVTAARAAVHGRPLDTAFRRPTGEPADLRWLLLHMIQEYARHNGHADLLREHIDGRTGE
ncbi:DinB family protein [Streptomyces sp. HNM0574]|uniref:DinB family protein n=1 Tax=Streptomyces sp. HNM0574 TaxID=2714954 RepID=UPI00146F81EC|nr:DinB family protein [Streptomyces sp. HNM0574]NLU70206.1 DinB family protein [Streptomyces sp. HNM0574]